MKTLCIALAASLALGFALPAPGVSVAARADAATYDIDSVHSSLVFRAKHLNVAYIYGRFNEYSGQFTFDPAKPESSKVEVEIQVESIDSGIEKRDAHLRSPDFFDAKQFPMATFKSKSVKKTKDGRFDIAGDLTIHGVTKPVTMDTELVGTASHPQLGDRIGFHGSFVIKRSEFGVSYSPEALGEEILVIVSMQGVKSEPTKK